MKGYRKYYFIFLWLKHNCFVVATMGRSGDVSEEPLTQKKRKKGWRMSCDAVEATEGLENDNNNK